MLSFWKWLVVGCGDKPGLFRVMNWWLVLHVFVGIALTFGVPASLGTAANSVLLPLVGILIGLSFAWGGNAQALLATEEIEGLSDHHPGGFEEYVYSFLLAILLILVSLVFWALAGLGVVDQPSPVHWGHKLYPAVTCFYYTLASITLRACWQVVLMSQLLLVARRTIRKRLGP